MLPRDVAQGGRQAQRAARADEKKQRSGGRRRRSRHGCEGGHTADAGEIRDKIR